MPDGQAEANLLWAYALIDGLASGGAAEAIISPGSRSTPLVLACETHPNMRITQMVDERSAAFLALGKARANASPVIVIATSGSAPAHWYPAVIEASHSGVPLLLISADRPPELHGWGANQTTDQQHLFGRHVRAFFDPGCALTEPEARQRLHQRAQELALLSGHPHPGPVQINLPLREPLVPTHRPNLPPPALRVHNEVPAETPGETDIDSIKAWIGGKPGMILCGSSDLGPTFAHGVTRLAEALNTPILADPLSGLRHGTHSQTHVLCHYDAYLEQADTPPPEWLLRFASMPVSKRLLLYLEHHQVPVILCDPWRRYSHTPPNTRMVIHADPVRLCAALTEAGIEPADIDHLDYLSTLERTVRATPPTGQDDDRPFEGDMVKALLDVLPDRSLLFSGNSMPIRQLDSWSGSSGKSIRIVANRGVSGIDGNLASFIGMAQGVKGAAVALLGDLTLYHDMNSLLAARDHDLTIILINNGGGAIFGHLPQARLDTFRDHWLCDTGLDFSHAAALYSLGYQQVSRQSSFVPALHKALGEGGPQLIEVKIDRQYSLQQHQVYRQRVARRLSEISGRK